MNALELGLPFAGLLAIMAYSAYRGLAYPRRKITVPFRLLCDNRRINAGLR